MKLALIIGLVAVPAALHAEPPPAIGITVRGAIDPALVAASVASELGSPVEPTAECSQSCITVEIAGATVTVGFHAAGGTARERTIALPADRSQWALQVALLAGNLVRDEADGLLIDAVPAAGGVILPPPVPMIPVPPVQRASVAAPIDVRSPRFSPFAIGIVPWASTDLLDLDRSHLVSVGLVAETSSRVRGLAVSGAADIAGEVDGLQIAGAVDVARELDGAQVSGGVAVAGDMTGVQVAGGVTVARQSRGTQIAGGVAIAQHSAGTQIAGGVAVARESAGTQIAGGIVIAQQSEGTQIAGGVAVAEHGADTQIAGGVTVTGHLAGVQIAPINIARRNDGVQIGVLNIGGGLDGRAFGLINIVPGGRTDLEAAVDSDRTGTVLLRHGSRAWHNVYGVGGQHVDTASGMPNDDVWMIGFGFGPSFHLAGLPTDLEAIGWHVNHGRSLDDHLSLLAQLRLTISVPLGTAALIAGGAINTYITDDPVSPLAIARTSADPMTSDVHVHVWPSLFVGARL